MSLQLPELEGVSIYPPSGSTEDHVMLLCDSLHYLNPVSQRVYVQPEL